MLKYADGLVTDEDDITGALIGRLDSAFDEKLVVSHGLPPFLDTVRGSCSREEVWCRHAVPCFNPDTATRVLKGGSDSIEED